MRRLTTVAVTCLILGPSLAAEPPPELIQQSRAAVKDFAQSLQGELKQAMQAGGPIAAVSVCHEMAPGIATRVSTEHGVNLGRTSLKARNPDNVPDAWEAEQLQDFADQLAAGTPPGQVEEAVVVEYQGEPLFRYMRAIPTGQVCLACHGSNIDPELAAHIDSLYPEDAARGFQPGELRGAFSVTAVPD